MEKVKTFIEEKSLIETGDHIIVGVSGGADSVYLLRVLCSLQKEKDLSITAVHINHQIREEAVRDQWFVQDLCKKLGVSCEVFCVDVKGLAQKEKLSIEEAGRKARYDIFYKKQKELQGKIAVAHHKNDQAETFLFRVSRGTGINGAGAMKAADFPVIRPLLSMTKQEIKKELVQIGQTWVEDATNADDTYARNQIRNQVMPRLEKINEKTVEHICFLTEDIQEVMGYLKENIKNAYEYVVIKKNRSFLLDIEKLEREHSWIQKQVIKRAMEELAGKKKDLEKRHIFELLDLTKKETGKRISLPYGIIAEKSYQMILLYQEKNYDNSAISGKLLQEETNDFGNIEEKDCIQIIDYDKIKKGIRLRCREPGDFFTFGPDAKKKSLSRYFIDEKIPRHQRDTIPLVADGSHIIWIIGRRISSYYKVSENTKRYLKLKFIKEGEKTNAKDQRVNFRGKSKCKNC